MTGANLDDILTVPVATDTNWSAEEIQQELDNNAQGVSWGLRCTLG